MNGAISVTHVIFGGLLILGVVAVAGFCCSLLCLHALGGVKARMVTNEKLEVFKAGLEKFFDHKLNNGLGVQSNAINELRAEFTESARAVAGIQTSNSALVRQMEQMSHGLMRIHEDQVNRLLDQLGIARKASTLTIEGPASSETFPA